MGSSRVTLEQFVKYERSEFSVAEWRSEDIPQKWRVITGAPLKLKCFSNLYWSNNKKVNIKKKEKPNYYFFFFLTRLVH